MDHELTKMYGFLPRRTDLSRAQFHQHWRTAHVEHALKIKRIRRYVQSHRVADPVPGLPAAPYDGVAEIWYADLESALGMGEDPDYTEHAALDEPNFINMGASGVVFTQTRVGLGRGVLDVDTPAVKVLVMARRPREVSPEQFATSWRALAHDVDALVPGVVRIEVSTADQNLYRGDQAQPDTEPPFDGLLAMWWPDRPTFDVDWARAGTSVVQRVTDITDEASSGAGLFEELRVIWPPESSSN